MSIRFSQPLSTNWWLFNFGASTSIRAHVICHEIYILKSQTNCRSVAVVKWRDSIHCQYSSEYIHEVNCYNEGERNKERKNSFVTIRLVLSSLHKCVSRSITPYSEFPDNFHICIVSYLEVNKENFRRGLLLIQQILINLNAIFSG